MPACGGVFFLCRANGIIEKKFRRALMADDVLLRMTDITKTFPGVKALDHVSLNLEAGTVHALMGENGAGKSTLMKCLFGIYNKDSSMESFAHACFKYAIETKQDLWFSAKDTISKKYDMRFRDVFQEIYDSTYKNEFEKLGLTYFYTLIDDAVARVVRSDGGFIWALKNYDGDVMSDMVSTAFGSLAMMTSVLVSPEGNFEYEAAHGTVTRHYYKYLEGEKTSTNPMATIFAWTGALKKRGELDGLADLEAFGAKLEEACIETLNDGIMTKDLVGLVTDGGATSVNTKDFIAEIRKRLESKLA